MMTVVHNNIGVASCLVATLLVGHFVLHIPALAPFVELQHAISTEELKDPTGGPRYQRDWLDYYYVITWIIGFTFLRAAVMQWVLRPLARSQGVYAPAKLQRFMEQGWLVLFYSISWSVGMWLMHHNNYWFDTTAMWRDYPYYQLSAPTKHYYLIQLAFWWQQLLIVNVEEKRKDYGVMVSHHIITIFLVMGSYYTHLTPVGNAILCCMDFADILLSVSA
jgi:acyl-CoA-dependent ceramide synthase